MFGINMGQEAPQQEPPKQQQPDLAAQLAEERAQREKLQEQVQHLRDHSMRSADTANQQISLLRGQLAEAVRPQAQHAPAQPTDDGGIFSFLNGGAAPTQTPANAQGERLMTPSEVRRMIQEEKQREAQAHYAEAQKIEELNSRFMAEFPELAKNPNAIAAVRNQFQAVSNLRSDLPAEQRYRLAIDNVQQQLMPLLAPPASPKDSKEKKPDTQPNPYMPNVFAPPPGHQSLNSRLNGGVDVRSLEDKFSAREQELKQWRQQQAKQQGR